MKSYFYLLLIFIITPVLFIPTTNTQPLLKPSANLIFTLASSSPQNLRQIVKLADSSNSEVSSKDADVYFNRGAAHFESKEYQKAIADFTQAIAIDPDYPYTYIYRGLAYFELQEYQRAITNCTQAIAIKPNFADTYKLRGRAYFELQEYQKAIADFTLAITLNPDDDSAYRNRGRAYFKLQEYQKAIADMKKAEYLFEQLKKIQRQP